MVRWSNTELNEVPKREEIKGTEKLIKEIKDENFLELIKSIKSLTKEIQWLLRWPIFKMSRHYSNTSENLKQREHLQQKQITFNEITIILTGDFLTATTEARRQWNNNE